MQTPESPREPDPASASLPGKTTTSGKAIASLVLALLQPIGLCLVGIPSIILGILALSQIDSSRGRLKGSGLAITGIALSCLGLLLLVVAAMLLPAVNMARSSRPRAEAISNVSEIGLAIRLYDELHGTFPPAYSVDEDFKPLLSWRVLILPYIGQDALYQEFHLDEPWDSEHNKRLIARMPEVYASPGVQNEEGKTHYLTPRGENTMFPGGGRSLGAAHADDGFTRIIMVVEAGPQAAVIWTKPDDLPVSEKDPTAVLFGLRRGGFIACFCDRHAKFISEDADPQALFKLFNRNDGEPSLDE